ncbi:MAG: ORF6N domain-containing protein [Candidatus Omnitrophica bacterium]|nr:ORF6N domain-containing protein [Candidatus Omnitrophota bacterium]MDD5670492.1 ORF6N domain-containing protein [Candidatus Omnitrophota bacterium]
MNELSGDRITTGIEKTIFRVQNHRVMLDSHLAMLYGVKTKALLQSVKRNLPRFPEDFMFQLTRNEERSLRSQFVTSKKERGGRRYLPYVFTEQGVAMLSSVLHSEKAIRVNIAMMRAFVKLRRAMSTTQRLTQKLDELEDKIKTHDNDILAIFEAIRQLMKSPEPPRHRIGFHP